MGQEISSLVGVDNLVGSSVLGGRSGIIDQMELENLTISYDVGDFERVVDTGEVIKVGDVSIPLRYRPAVMDTTSPGHNDRLTRFGDEAWEDFVLSGKEFVPPKPLRRVDQPIVGTIAPCDRGLTKFFESVTTAEGMHMVYFGRAQSESDVSYDLVGKIVANSPEGSAARERVRWITAQIVATADKKVLRGESNVTIVSIAAGLGLGEKQAVEIITGRHSNLQINMLLVDNDQDALDVTDRETQEQSRPDIVRIRTMNADALSSELAPSVEERVNELFCTSEIDAVVLIGLLDYLKDRVATRVLDSCKKLLDEDGVLLTAQVNKRSTKELFHLYSINGWGGMIHRSPKEFADLLVFNDRFRASNLELEQTSPQTGGAITLAKVK